MYISIAEFIEEWKQESALTQQILDALSNESLQQQVASEDRTLGRMAWHVVTSTPGMLSEFGLNLEMVKNSDTVPLTANEIAETYRKVSKDASEAISQQWTDSSLKETKNVFGRNLSKTAMLSLFIKHIIHHRGQITVLMRQAGLKVPGIYGPAREEWSSIGMQAPTV
jgi:uncharacterized damage-inducible protein DinB